MIFLTGRGLETERIAGLKLGADDYVVKPFSLGEVSARIESVLRRAGVNATHHRIEAPTIVFGDLQINENTHEVRLNGRLLDLTSQGVRPPGIHGEVAPPGLLARPAPRARVGLLDGVAERGDGHRAYSTPPRKARRRPRQTAVD